MSRATDLNLGDLNGNGVTAKADIRANVVRQDSAPVIMPNASTQQAIQIIAYDANNRLSYQIDAEGNKSTYAYDASGKLTEQISDVSYTLFTSASGKSMEYAVNPSLRNSAATPTLQFASVKTTTAYDTLGRATSTTDPRGVRTDYYYNVHDELTSTVVAAAIDTSYGQTPAEPTGLDHPTLEAYALISSSGDNT